MEKKSVGRQINPLSAAVTVNVVFFRRQLSKEQQDLKVALERQASLNQKLSQEKEQLMFKLRHRDSGPTIHLPAMVQELAPR